MEVRRGDVFLVNLEPVVGSEQGKTRPCLVIQNDEGNKFSPTIIIAPTTTKFFTKEFPTNVEITSEESGLDFNSTVLLNQLRTIDKLRLIKKLCHLNPAIMYKVDLAIKASLDLN